MIKQTQKFVNEQVQNQFTSRLIKNIQLNEEMLKDDNIDIFIQSLSHTLFINIKISLQQNLFPFLQKLNQLSQLEGLHLNFGYYVYTDHEIKYLSEALVHLPNLKNFAYKIETENVDFELIGQSLTQEFSKLQNLETITLQFDRFNLQIQGIKSISPPLKHLRKLKELNIDIGFLKKYEELNQGDLEELIKDITSLVQLKHLNIRIASYYRKNNLRSKQTIYQFDVSKLINLTVLCIKFTQINIYLHIDFLDLPNQITKLQNLEQLYILIHNRTFSSDQIAPLYDNAVALQKLQIFQLFIEITKEKQKNTNKEIVLGSKKIESSNLKELNLNLCSHGGRKKLQFANQQEAITKLEKLSLSLENIQLSEKSFFSFSNWIKNCSFLKVLTLTLRQRVYPESFLKSLGNTFAQLKNLIEIILDIKLKNSKQQDLLLEAITYASNLEALSIRCKNFFLDQEKNEIPNQILKFINLKQFNLDIGFPESIEESVSCISKIIPSLSQITKFCLRLNHRNISPISYREFGSNLNSLSNLRDFSILLCQHSKLTHQETYDLFSGIGQLLNLQYLKIYITTDYLFENSQYDFISQNLTRLKKLKGIKLSNVLYSKLKILRKLHYLICFNSVYL